MGVPKIGIPPVPVVRSTPVVPEERMVVKSLRTSTSSRLVMAACLGVVGPLLV